MTKHHPNTRPQVCRGHLLPRVRTGLLGIGIFLLIGCAQLGGTPGAATALAAADRSAEDKARDVGRKPAQVMDILGFGAGMTIMDIIAAGGYYSEVMAAVVGPSGTVYAQNPAAVLKFRDGANLKAMKRRQAGGRLPNVVRFDFEFDSLPLAPNALDGAFTALNFHDVYNRDPQLATAMLARVFQLLKPGGVLGLIDHVGIDGADNVKLHRMRKEDAIAAAQQVGFELVQDSPLLASSDDDHATFVFDPDIRGKTDRFLLKLRKPQTGG